MKTVIVAALLTSAALTTATPAFAQEAPNAAATNAAATNAPAPAGGTNVVAEGLPPVDAGPAITGKVLALRDKDGKVSSVKILADDAVYHVTLDDKAEELAKEARFKTVKAHGPVTIEKPEGATISRRVIAVSSFTLLEATTNSPAGLLKAPAETNAPAGSGETNAPAKPEQTNAPAANS